MLDLIADAVGERSARGIAAAISRLISRGQLCDGTRLPTVRTVAHHLGVSPTTVSEAWGSLTQAGVIQTCGRSGTFVALSDRPRRRLRYARLSESPATIPCDLSTGIPDHDLLPSLTIALRLAGEAKLTTSYLDDPVLPVLEILLRQRWPYPPQQLTVVDGALDALDRVSRAVLRFGDHVLVENPTFPATLDLLEAIGAVPVGVAMDEHGLLPDALAAALDGVPTALYVQPRAHNPTGASMTATRAAELAGILAGTGVVIVEDDHAADIATATPVSLGTHLPERTVRVHSFSKSHGPDLRLAAVGGPASVLAEVTDRRLLGPGWSSRLLQAVLVALLTDPESIEQVEHARHEYARRRAMMLAALAERGVAASAGDGINLWLTVADQQAAMVSLAAHGIAVAPGSPFEVTGLRADHVRVTVGLIRDGFEELADLLAEAAQPRHRHRPGDARRQAPPRTGR